MKNRLDRAALSAAILSHIMLNAKEEPVVLDKAFSVITVDMMPTDGLKEVFLAIERLHTADFPVDMVTVFQECSLPPLKVCALHTYHPGMGHYDFWLFLLFEYHYAARLYGLLLPFQSSHSVKEILYDILHQSKKLSTVEDALQYLLKEGGIEELMSPSLEKQLKALSRELEEGIDRLQLLGFYNKYQKF